MSYFNSTFVYEIAFFNLSNQSFHEHANSISARKYIMRKVVKNCYSWTGISGIVLVFFFIFAFRRI